MGLILNDYGYGGWLSLYESQFNIGVTIDIDSEAPVRGLFKSWTKESVQILIGWKKHVMMVG